MHSTVSFNDTYSSDTFESSTTTSTSFSDAFTLEDDSEYDEEVRKGNFKLNADKIQTFELLNKNILIAGFGRIGKKLISRIVEKLNI